MLLAFCSSGGLGGALVAGAWYSWATTSMASRTDRKWCEEAWCWSLHFVWVMALLVAFFLEPSASGLLFMAWFFFTLVGLLVGWPVVLVLGPVVFWRLRVTCGLWPSVQAEKIALDKLDA